MFIKKVLYYYILTFWIYNLKMLCLYLYTLIIGHTSCNKKLSILNKLKLQKKLQILWQTICFWKKVKTTIEKNQTYKPFWEPGIERGTSRIQSGWVTSALPSQLRVKIVVKLFNCFDAMGRNVNKRSRLCGPHIINKFIFSVIFLHPWITIFGSVS